MMDFLNEAQLITSNQIYTFNKTLGRITKHFCFSYQLSINILESQSRLFIDCVVKISWRMNATITSADHIRSFQI